jgi:hypothetical protein
MAAINNANEKTVAGQLCQQEIAGGGATIRARLLDRSFRVMTSPKPAHETIPNWPPSNWNGGRDQIGIGGRLRWNPQSTLRLPNLLRLSPLRAPAALVLQGVPGGFLGNLGHSVRLAQADAQDLPDGHRGILQRGEGQEHAGVLPRP